MEYQTDPENTSPAALKERKTFHFWDSPAKKYATKTGEYRFKSLFDVRLDKDGQLITHVSWYNSRMTADQYLSPILKQFGPFDTDKKLITWVLGCVHQTGKNPREQQQLLDKLNELKSQKERTFQSGACVLARLDGKEYVGVIAGADCLDESLLWEWESPKYQVKVLFSLDEEVNVITAEERNLSMCEIENEEELRELSHSLQYQNVKNESLRAQKLWSDHVVRVKNIMKIDVMKLLTERNAGRTKSSLIPVTSILFEHVFRDSGIVFQLQRVRYKAEASLQTWKHFLGITHSMARKITVEEIVVRRTRRGRKKRKVIKTKYLVPVGFELEWHCRSCEFRTTLLVDQIDE